MHKFLMIIRRVCSNSLEFKKFFDMFKIFKKPAKQLLIYSIISYKSFKSSHILYTQ